MSTPVLAHVITPTRFHVHRPPRGFEPPPPEQWAEVADLAAWCAVPIPGTAGYGELEVLMLAEALGQCSLSWCPLCYPMGRPSG